MEEKIYDRQVTKQSLSLRVIDERQIGRHYTATDLAELFTYCPAPPPTEAAHPPATPRTRPQVSMLRLYSTSTAPPPCQSVILQVCLLEVVPFVPLS